MKQKLAHDESSIYFDILDRSGNLKGARSEYQRLFGLSINDRRIDAEIEQLYADAVGGEFPRHNIQIPARLVLAIILREGFGGRGQGHKQTAWQRVTKARWMDWYRTLRAEGMSKEEAVEKVSSASTLSPAAILDGRPNRRRAQSGKKPGRKIGKR